MKNSEIAKLFRKIKSLGLFTNSRTHEKVYKKLKENPSGEDGAQFIATTGVPEGKKECSKCGKVLPTARFSFYQTRVGSDGALLSANAVCDKCSKELAAERREAFRKDKSKIPPKPKAGDKCPKCKRAWFKTWHRDHDYKTGKFRRWLCGQCNMAQHDRRTPDPK
ncbi:MAG: endonuclease domain-containing protein [Gammaproteobacteria bacterium]|nr:endonuclease domain-containing protein [Gammaproteobacteria bacterium]